MASSHNMSVLVSGVGLTTAIGQGKEKIVESLRAGSHNFSIMKRPGRQVPQDGAKNAFEFMGAEIGELYLPEKIDRSSLRTVSHSAQVALASLDEAWHEANLDEVDPTRIGLVVGGSNFQQRELAVAHDRFREKVNFLRPTYGLSFMDTDLCGICTENYNIKGLSCTLGGASASGQLALIQAKNTILSGQVDVCVVIGALMDISYWECQGFRAIGAMGSNKYSGQPELAARPFDTDHDGFIFGESCAAIVLEKEGAHPRKSVSPYARIRGTGVYVDGNRNPDPSLEGEITAVNSALEASGIRPGEIDYVNPHGTGSIVGDETEAQALIRCELNGAYVNTSKSLIGHGLAAAGSSEFALTLLQMKNGFLHPCRNLDAPITDEINFVRGESVETGVERAINLSMGFGGINTAVVVEKI